MVKLLQIGVAITILGTVSRSEGSWVIPPCEGVEGLQYGKLYSSAVGGEVSYHVMLPPGYDQSSSRKFPVIYWLHGTNGSSKASKGIPFVANFYGRLMKGGKVPPAIVVFPNGLDHGMWCDSANGAQNPETMLVSDLIPHIDKIYRTVSTRGARAIEGFSMGGYGAGRIGFKYNSLFGAITMYGSGPLHDDFLKEDKNLQPVWARAKIFRDTYGSDMDYYMSNLPGTLALKVIENSHLRDHPMIRIVVGAEDPLRENNAALSKKLREDFGIEHSYQNIEGIGHAVQQILLASEDATGKFYQSAFGNL